MRSSWRALETGHGHLACPDAQAREGLDRRELNSSEEVPVLPSLSCLQTALRQPRILLLKSHQPVKLPSCLQTAASSVPSPGTSPRCVASHSRGITHAKAAPEPLLSAQPWDPGATPRQDSQRGLWAIIPGRHTPTPTSGTRAPSPSRLSLSPCETSTGPFPKPGPEDLGQVVSAWGCWFQGAGLPRGHLDASLAPPSTVRLGELLTLSFHIHKMGTMVPNPQNSSKTGTERGNLGGLGQRVRHGALCVLQSTEGPTSQLQPHGGRPPLACHRPTEPPACYGPTEAPPVSATAPRVCPLLRGVPENSVVFMWVPQGLPSQRKTD